MTAVPVASWITLSRKRAGDRRKNSAFGLSITTWCLKGMRGLFPTQSLVESTALGSGQDFP
ncbi:hypothetical protein UR09_00665 [Candidatus Nitromaritima sp. SCGC AAA799-A02]|nr:hypothetical protein UR09_00665 [Candidatus Nitromaritima sp. SCGC AAA799-A02]